MQDTCKEEEYTPKFCSDCGMALAKLDVVCTSKDCEVCGKKIYYTRSAKDGGIYVEKGEKLHMPPMEFSLDPNTGGTFFRSGYEGHLRRLFLEEKIHPDELVKRLKEQEIAIDKELNSLECIEHCDLNSDKGVEEAARILESHGLMTHWYNLARSGLLRECYEAIECNETLIAVHSCHMANIMKEFSLLEDEHLKEILWLGYLTYIDLKRNEGMTVESAKEQQLIKSTSEKIKSLSNEVLFPLINDGLEVANRLSISGINEKTLKSLLEHEYNSRQIVQQSSIKERELKLQETANKIKLWGFIFTLANALILIWYKDWLS